MQTTFDARKNEFTVTIGRQELEDAFRSPSELQLLMHNICLQSYGTRMADELFPIGELSDKVINFIRKDRT